jgi:hypothetical protein
LRIGSPVACAFSCPHRQRGSFGHATPFLIELTKSIRAVETLSFF